MPQNFSLAEFTRNERRLFFRDRNTFHNRNNFQDRDNFRNPNNFRKQNNYSNHDNVNGRNICRNFSKRYSFPNLNNKRNPHNPPNRNDYRNNQSFDNARQHFPKDKYSNNYLKQYANSDTKLPLTNPDQSPKQSII